MFKPINKTKKYKQIKPINIKGVDFMIDNVDFTIIKEANSFILCSPENTNYVLYIMRDKFDECFELIEDKVMEKVKENIIMTQSQNNNKLQTHENLHARLGDTIILSNGLKLKVCKDFYDGDIQYYKTVDISCNINVTIGYSESNIKEFCIGKKVWGYDVDKFEIVDIERKKVKVNKVKIEQNVNHNSKQKVYTYEMIPHSIHWKVKYNNEIINQETDSGNESYKLITNGNNTIVILDDGCKGFAKCMPSDEYNLDKGIDIAYTKALIKSYQKKLEELIK